MPDSFETAVYRKVTWRLLPILFLCYVISYLDRVNVGFAKLQMLHDLRFSEATYGLGAGIFFLGYCSSEIPSNLMLVRIGPRRWLAGIMVTWGVVSSCMMFVHSAGSFYLLRCLLGVAEAGMFPGAIFYLTRWFPSHRRGRMIALFMTAQPVSGVIGGPLSGWIMQFSNGAGHLSGWQWLFVVEALPAVLVGLALLSLLPDGIRDAPWISAEEKRFLEAQIEGEAAGKHRYHSLAGVVRNPRVWLLALISFCSVMGLYGIGFWLPTIIRATGIEQPLRVGLLMMIPYGTAIVVMLLAGRSSDRMGERRWHLAISTVAGGLGLVFATIYAGSTALSLAGLTLATAGIITSQPLFWNLPTAFLGGTAAAAGIALINMVANSAGFVSPYVVGWITGITHSTAIGMYVLAAWLFVGSGLTLCVPAELVNTIRPAPTEVR